MPFYPPSWVPKLPMDPPDNVSIADFMLDDSSGRLPLSQSRPSFICGYSGKQYTAPQSKERVEHLARGLAKEFGWDANKGTEWDKVVGVFSVNTLDTIILSWAIQRLGGISTPANAAYSQSELEHQFKDSGAKYVFTSAPQLEITINVCKKIGIPANRIYLLEVPKEANNGKGTPSGYKTVDDLINEGKSQPKVAALNWSKGEGARRTAFLCYSSGTSGLPKGVMISHRNVICNTMQISTYDTVYRSQQHKAQGGPQYTEMVLGLLPMSHIYGLVVICHASLYMGDGIVVMPKFELHSCLSSIQTYKINNLFLVPPIILIFLNNPKELEKYDLSSVTQLFTGAAPLGIESMHKLNKVYPAWQIRQGYGLTETCTVVSSSSPTDLFYGSCGSLVPGFEAKIVTAEGNEITGYDQPGELWAKSPSVTLGYLNRPDATKETFVDGYMRTGDEAVVRKSPQGHEHIFIVDRIKELIKVKGLQVPPAELEAYLLASPLVADCAVIPIPDDAAGERPKAFVVRSQGQGIEDNESVVKRQIHKHVEEGKARHKWIKEIEFIDVIPKSPSGKILRRLLRDKDREARGRRQKL